MTTGPSPATPTLRAVIYLRVSTRDQAKRGGEDEGFSIPAQRDACHRKADSLGATVVREFVDAGESARSADRPDLRDMLAYAKQVRPDYVIVHKVDRLARNRVDDVEITVALTASGARLVSCTENIDETPSGMLLHGIMSSIAEFYSRNLGTEAKKGMSQKAKRGGKPGLAPFGYLNTSRRTDEGYEVRTVALDPERAPWVRWIFEQYATGEWTVGMLCEELERRGVTTVPRPKRPARPLSYSLVHSILKNRFYTGVVTFNGAEHPGNHDALVSEELFDRCRRVRTSRNQSGEKPRVRTHYLKGSVFCGQCGEALSYEVTRNRHGTYYEYFYCLGRQALKNGCTFIATQAATVERLVADHWETIQLTDEFTQHIRTVVWAHVEVVLASQHRERVDAERRLSTLQREADKLLQAYYADAISTDQLKAEQARIAAARATAARAMEQSQATEEGIKAKLEYCCTLLSAAHQQYLACDDLGKRELNQAVFERFYIDDDEVVGSDLTAPYYKLLDEELEQTLAGEAGRVPVAKLSQTGTGDGGQPVTYASGILVPRVRRQPRYARTCRLGRERPRGYLPWELKNPRPEDEGSNVTLLVEINKYYSNYSFIY